MSKNKATLKFFNFIYLFLSAFIIYVLVSTPVIKIKGGFNLTSDLVGQLTNSIDMGSINLAECIGDGIELNEIEVNIEAKQALQMLKFKSSDFKDNEDGSCANATVYAMETKALDSLFDSLTLSLVPKLQEYGNTMVSDVLSNALLLFAEGILTETINGMDQAGAQAALNDISITSDSFINQGATCKEIIFTNNSTIDDVMNSINTFMNGIFTSLSSTYTEFQYINMDGELGNNFKLTLVSELKENNVIQSDEIHFNDVDDVIISMLDKLTIPNEPSESINMAVSLLLSEYLGVKAYSFLSYAMISLALLLLFSVIIWSMLLVQLVIKSIVKTKCYIFTDPILVLGIIIWLIVGFSLPYLNNIVDSTGLLLGNTINKVLGMIKNFDISTSITIAGIGSLVLCLLSVPYLIFKTKYKKDIDIDEE